MKLLLLFCSLCFLSGACYSQARVILDTDMDSDVDDVAALAMLHNLSANRQVRLEGVIVTSDDSYSPICTSAINSYYRNGRLPVGFKKTQATLTNHSRYTKLISEEFPHRLKSYSDAWEAVSLYRKLLSTSADSSVIIITIGHLTSLQDLLKSGGDMYSPLSGKELALRKVSKWICMGGMFPSGKEANFYRPDPESTSYCLKEWTNPVIFCGWEAGKEIISGGQQLKASLTSGSPVYRAFELYNNFAGRPSWDQLAILLLTANSAKFFDIISDGYCTVNPDGSNKWINGPKSNHSYITLKPAADRSEITAVINNMLIR